VPSFDLGLDLDRDLECESRLLRYLGLGEGDLLRDDGVGDLFRYLLGERERDAFKRVLDRDRSSPRIEESLLPFL
jgi:hypothetical protein